MHPPEVRALIQRLLQDDCDHAESMGIIEKLRAMGVSGPVVVDKIFKSEIQPEEQP